MADLKLQIMDFIKRKGSSTPVEIAVGTGINSIIVSAIVSDMASKRQLLMSNKRIGSSHIYFLQDQRDRMRVKVFQMLEESEKKMVEDLEKRRIILSSEIPDEDIAGCKDFLVEFTYGGEKAWYWFELDSNAALSELRAKVESKCGGAAAPQHVPRYGAATKKLPEEKPPEKKVEPPLPQPEKPQTREEIKKPAPQPKKEVQKKEKAKPKERPKGEYIEKVKSWVEEAGAKVLGVREVVAGVEYEIEAQLQTPFGAQQYLVLVLNYPKKKVGIEEVSKAFSRVMQQKSPVVLVSPTGFAKNAENFWKKEYKGLITLIDGESLGLS